MRVPLSWLSDYVEITLDAEALADVLTIGGLTVEAVHHPTAGTRGVVIAEVLDVAKVEGSDKLHLVHVTDGSETHEIVCGAANYAPGDRVAAALPGATLPGGFEIGRKKLFGHTSNGMLASARELGIGEDHAGIWVLDPHAPLGEDLTAWLDLDDPVLEFEVTPDRGYGLSVMGVARDVAALTGAALRLPEPRAPERGAEDPVPVEIDDPERCRRFDGRTIRGVTIGRSPAWLQRRLAAAGMRPVSNIVDATNYVMLETGNPIHAYDLALLAGPRIEVRTARPGERLTTLDGVERDLDPDDLLICDADGPVALAGVMGGEATEINQATTDVLLEVASFSARTVLRTARRHRLLTEGSKRWEKTVPPQSAPLAAGRCAELITQLAGGREVTGSDTYPNPAGPVTITLRPARTRSILGIELDPQRQAELLRAIDCTVSEHTESLEVTAPAYRPDLQIEADLLEEIARLHGYPQFPSTVPSSGRTGGRAPEDESLRTVRRALAGAGWTEVLNLPFVAADEAEQLSLAADDRRAQPIALVNPLSQEESVLRTTLLPGLLRTVRRNANRQLTDLALFEVGHVFLPPTPDDPGADGGPDGVTLPTEPRMLGFVASGRFDAPRHDGAARDADVYDLLGAVEVVRAALHLEGLEVEATQQLPYHPGRAALVRLEGAEVGVVGELHPRVIAAYELPPRTLVGELRLDHLVAGGVRAPSVSAPSALPGMRIDVAVVVDEDVPAGAVADAISAGAGELLTHLSLFDVFRGSQIGQGRKSLAYALRLDDPARQLTDADAAGVIETVEAAVRERVGGALRR